MIVIDSDVASEAAAIAAERDEHGQSTGLTVLAALQREPHGRTVAQLEKHAELLLELGQPNRCLDSGRFARQLAHPDELSPGRADDSSISGCG